MRFHVISWDFMGLHVTSWDFMGLHGASWGFMGLHGASWGFMGLHVNFLGLIIKYFFLETEKNTICFFLKKWI